MNVQGIESGTYSLKHMYPVDRLSDKERDLFEDYQRRINDSIQRQNITNTNTGTNSQQSQSLNSTAMKPQIMAGGRTITEATPSGQSTQANLFIIPQRILNPIVFNSSITATPTNGELNAKNNSQGAFSSIEDAA